MRCPTPTETKPPRTAAPGCATRSQASAPEWAGPRWWTATHCERRRIDPASGRPVAPPPSPARQRLVAATTSATHQWLRPCAPQTTGAAPAVAGHWRWHGGVSFNSSIIIGRSSSWAERSDGNCVARAYSDEDCRIFIAFLKKYFTLFPLFHC